MFAQAQKRKRIKNDLVAALDIGTNKVCCAIGAHQDSEKGGIRLLGIGQHSSKGVRAGSITDMEALEEAVLNAVHAAEQMAECTIGTLHVSLPACFIQSSIVSVEMTLGSDPVDGDHVRHLLTLGKHTKEMKSAQIIHALPLHYTLDEQEGIRDPKGMFGQTLKATIHLLSAPNSFLKNVAACIGRCHLDVSGFIVSSYASGLATLVDDELEMGVTVIDIGGGSTTLASFLQGSLVHLSSFPMGGQHITSDIARGLSTPMSQAERLKTLYGSVFPLTVEDKEYIIVPQLGDHISSTAHQVPKSLFLKIIRARVEEIFEHLWDDLENTASPDLLRQRIVITGGGSQLPGLSEFVAHQWKRPVRIGHPMGVQGGGDFSQSPSFATCAGLLHYAYRDDRSREVNLPTLKHQGHLWQRFLSWCRENI